MQKSAPERTLPLGIVIALIISTAIYFAVVLIATLNATPAELARSDSPLALVYRQATGTEPLLIGAIGALAAINGALVQIIMASRIFYGMSDKGWLPAILKTVHPRTNTPIKKGAGAEMFQRRNRADKSGARNISAPAPFFPAPFPRYARQSR